MRWIFLLPLITCVASGYLCKKSSDEMAYLTGTATVVSLILTLILAPWQVQLLVLGGTIFSTKKLLAKNESKSLLTIGDRPQVDIAQILSENDAATEAKRMYRGAPIPNSAKTPAPQPNPANLKYRGASGLPGKVSEQ